MPLVPCPECGHQVSADASACPECGFPFDEAAATGHSPETLAARVAHVLHRTAIECKAIPIATFERIRRQFHRVQIGHRVSCQRRNLATCREQLGEWLIQHDLGDAELRSSIRQLDAQIEAVHQAHGSARHLQKERRQSLIRLSTTHVPAATDTEIQSYQLVQQAEKRLQSYEHELLAASRSTDSPDGITRRRIAVGYSVMALSCSIVVVAMFARLGEEPQKLGPPSAGASPQAVADVVGDHTNSPEPLLLDIPSFTSNVPALTVETIEQRVPHATAVYGPALPPDKATQAAVKYQGRLVKIDMEFVRRHDPAPFRLAITEETPGSSGPSLESSIWIAATVAALHRSDALSGVEVKFSVPGDVDGPSAGGVVCLALLSALENKRLPDNFAFTGTVLPDGTIGRVGGVVEKINAAKSKGATRVLVPAGIRFEEDMNSGKLTDLKQLAESLNLQFLPVRNIEQAYHAVHGTPSPAPVSAPAAFAELPQSLERVLIDDCRKRLDRGDAIWKNLSESEQNELINDPLATDWIHFRLQADQSYRAGQLCYAWERATEWTLLMQSREANKQFFSGPATKADSQRLFSELDAQIQKAFADAPQPHDVVQLLSAALPPIASQFCVDADAFHSYRQIVGQIEKKLARDLQVIKDMEDGHLPAATTREQLAVQSALQAKAVALLVANLALRWQQGYAEDAKQRSKYLPPVPLDSRRAPQVEQFFYMAYRSIYQSLETEVINQIAGGADISGTQARQLVAETDQDFMHHMPLHVEAMESHQRLLRRTDTATDRDFLTALYAQMFATYIADVSSVVVRWTELDTELNDDGNKTYRRLDVLSYMLREARESAVAKIVECNRHGVPCPAAIWWFQAGEATRDDNRVDKVEALAHYWRASLHAQSLQMLFRGQR